MKPMKDIIKAKS